MDREVIHLESVPNKPCFFADENGNIWMKIHSGCGSFFDLRKVTPNSEQEWNEMVCSAFHGPRPDARSFVFHKNLDKSDRRASNLTWSNYTRSRM